MAKRKIFYSFHFDEDCWRTGQVRNIGAIEGSKPVSPNDWEEVKRKGKPAIEKWIDDQLASRSCTVVLVGSKTATRPWVKHEIKRSWELKKGVVGIHIHKLEDNTGLQSSKGQNPFSEFTLNGTTLDKVVKCYNPVLNGTGKEAYAWIEKNLANAVEVAIKIRDNY